MQRKPRLTISLALSASVLCCTILAAHNVFAQDERESVHQPTGGLSSAKVIVGTEQPAAVVQSLNNLTGKVKLAEGQGIRIDKAKQTLTLSFGLPFWTFYDVSGGTGFRIDVNGSEFSNSTSIAGVVDGGPGNVGIMGFDDGPYSSGIGVYGYSEPGNGVTGESDGTGYAGYFMGRAHVSGILTKGGGAFKIDHPLDPENKYLYHSFIESPDMMNIYNGNVVMDENGEAMVELPEWFEALNKDFRYQLTCIGGFAPVYVKDKIQGNRFAISGGQPGLEVSWQVTGIRNDPFAEANRLPVEEEKSGSERGRYLHPLAYGQPPENGIDWMRTPEFARRLKGAEGAEPERR